MSWILTYIVPFIVLLGILVFVHEAGHFSVAKLFKIKVEKFSIGFGPRIFGWKRGDTEYRVSWIPLGGYVKMAGDDPTDDEAKNIPGSFLGADLWKRMLVVLAGPGVNLILPIFVLAGVWMNGRTFATPYVGEVHAGSPAEEAGLVPGDVVTAVDGKPVTQWREMAALIRELNGSDKPSPKKLTVNRDGQTLQFTLTPILREQDDDFGIRTPTPIIGISQYAPRPVLDPQVGSPAAAAGLRTGDVIAKINDLDVKFWVDVDRTFANLEAGPIKLHVLRYPPVPADPVLRKAAEKKLPEKLDVVLASPAKPDREALGLRSGELVVSLIEPDSPAEKAGLLNGDRIVSSGDRRFRSATDLSVWVADHEKEPKIPLTVEREGKSVDLTIEPVKKTERIRGTSRNQEKVWIGFDLENRYDQKSFIARTSNPFKALWGGTVWTGEIIAMNGKAFAKMFSGELSVRESIGGPIAIADATAVAVEESGWTGFLFMLVNMSVILGIMNLLPIPVLDGGHLAFFTVEAVMRRAPSLRVREVAQQAGLLFLLAIMAFVLVNDVVTRLFN